MREDIYGGLRNALEHGSTLEQAINSFISAGYPEADVRETAQYISGGVTSLTLPQTSTQPASSIPAKPQMQAAPLKPRPLVQPQLEIKPRHRPPSLLLIVLLIVLFLSLGGFVFSLIYKQQIAEFINNLIGP